MKTVNIIGKGPTYKGGRPEGEVACLNTIANHMPGKIDYLFCNDWDQINNISRETLERVERFIIPTFPHVGCVPDINRFANIDGSIIYNLHTAPVKFANIPTINAWSVAETAAAYLYDLGYEHFKFIGVSYPGNFTPKYSDIIGGTSPNNTEWLIENYKRITMRLSKRKYEFM